MLKVALPLVIVSFAASTPAAARQSAATFGPPSPKSTTAPRLEWPTRDGFGSRAEYGKPDNLLTENGVMLTRGSARRPIARNMEVALEPARGLVDRYGEPKKPMRLLLRVGTSF